MFENENNNDDDENGDFIVKFYIYYSWITLAITLALAPILFYTIFTQSSNIGRYKWLILNHTIWSLALEISLSLVKPRVILPASAGFQLGIFRESASSQSTAIATLIMIAFYVNSILGLVLTIGNRYIGVFDSKLKKYFNTKKFYAFILFIHIIIHIFNAFTVIPASQLDRSTILEWAMEYDETLKKYFEEPSFFMIPHSYHDIPVIIGISFISILYLFFCFVIYYFLKQIQKNNYLIISRLQTSLIASSLVQVTLTCVFLFTPLYFFMFCIRFNFAAPQTMTLLFCFMSTHSIIDFIATLYFVLPYRKFILQFLQLGNLRSKGGPIVHLKKGGLSRVKLHSIRNVATIA